MNKIAPQPSISTIFQGKANDEIQCMCKLPYPSPTRGDVEAIAVACRDGSIKVLDAETGEQLAAIAPKYTSHRNGDILKDQGASFVSIEHMHDHLVTCTSFGEAHFTKVSSLWGTTLISNLHQLPAPINVMRLHPSEEGIIAFGGLENDLQVWRGGEEPDRESDSPYASLKPHWSARNVKNDKLDLRVPICIADICFHPSSSREDFQLITATRYRQLRTYKSSQARRPISSVELSEYPISRMSLDPATEHEAESKTIFCDSHGNIIHANVSRGLVIGAYKGFSGAVASLALSEDGKSLAAGGMDCYVRMFSVPDHRQISSVYIGSRIRHLVVLSEPDEIKSEAESDVAEDEDVWDELEEAQDEPKNKRARRS